MVRSHKTQYSNVNFPEVRFWGKVRRAGADECWLWTGSLMTQGYGQFYLDGPKGAHRLAYEVSHGPIPDGQSVLHKCDVRACCNPSHLFLGTHKDNMADASRKGRMAVPRQRTRAFKAELIQRYLDGAGTMKELAAAYGVTKMTVHRWTKGLHKPYARPHARKVAA